MDCCDCLFQMVNRKCGLKKCPYKKDDYDQDESTSGAKLDGSINESALDGCGSIDYEV